MTGIIDLTSFNFIEQKEKKGDKKMAQQVKEKLESIDFVEKEQKVLDKQVKRENALAKMELFLIRLSKEPKSVKTDLEKI